jgi:MoaA/NifB/PqqE/SkfB family radical SAM enzyme
MNVLKEDWGLMQTVARIRNRAIRYLEERTQQTEYEQNHWFVVWNLTWSCNLSCEYCIAPTLKNKPRIDGDGVERGLETIRKIDPAVVFLFGGEPTLATNLPEALKRLREDRPHRFFMLASNGTLEPRVCEAIPYIDELQISLDTLEGRHPLIPNHRPSYLLPKIERYANLCREWDVAMRINVVVTKFNYRELPDIVEWVADRIPSAGFNFRPLAPRSDPNSVYFDPTTEREFKSIVKNLSTQVLGEVHTERIRYENYATCHKQFFLSHVYADGQLATCKGNHHLGDVREDLSKLGDSPWDLAKQGAELTLGYWTQVGYPGAPVCWKTCDWSESFNWFLWGQIPADNPYLYYLWGRLEEEEVDTLIRFIRKRFRRRVTREELEPFIAWDGAFAHGRKRIPAPAAR